MTIAQRLTPDQKRDLLRTASGHRISKERRQEFLTLGYIWEDEYESIRFKHDGIQALDHIRAETTP